MSAAFEFIVLQTAQYLKPMPETVANHVNTAIQQHRDFLHAQAEHIAFLEDLLVSVTSGRRFEQPALIELVRAIGAHRHSHGATDQDGVSDTEQDPPP